ncbi:MAG: DUF4921 family protein [Candidatus Moraniibacteriota bacterium]
MEIQIENKKTTKPYESELRQDLVTGDWVIIATARAKRPDDFARQERVSHDDGPDIFSDPEASGQEKDVLIYRRDDGEWSLRVFPNKYPAVSRGRSVHQLSEGPYFAMSGVGYHEVIVTRDPVRHLALLDTWQVAEVIDCFQERYLALMNKESVNYIQIFHNHGKEAGASIPHPHSQLMAIPIISPYAESILAGADQFYKSHRRKVYGVMLEHEKEVGKRIVYENDDFVVFAPYASRAAFELWVMGKRPNPYFERITDEEKFSVADALQKALFSLYQGLGDPAYNFYLYTAPANGRDYPHFQWHIQILPKTSTWGGFELATGVEISTIQPEVATEFLRGKLANA